MGNVLVVSSYILESVLRHEPLEVTILLNDVSGVEIVDVGALHAESDKDLTALVETTPSLDSEGDALMLCPKLLAKLRKPDLLDDLETVDRAAALAVRLQLPGHQVAHHGLEPHGLSCKRKPHEPELLDVRLCESGRDPPLWGWDIGDGIIRDNDVNGPPVCELGLFSGLGPSVVGHKGEILGDLCLLHAQPHVDRLRVHRPLVDGLEVLELWPCASEVVLTAENQGDIVDEPFSVDSHELVSEGVGLDAHHELLDVVGMVEPVDRPYIYLVVLVSHDLPERDLGCELPKESPDRRDDAANGPDVSDEHRVSEGIVEVSYHGREPKVEEEDAPGREADDVVVLGRESHVVNRAPGVSHRAVKSPSADVLLGPNSKAVIAVGKVVVDLESVDRLENMEKEGVDDHPRQDDNASEEQVVGEVGLAYLVPLRYLRLVREEDDEDQGDRGHEESLRLGSVGGNAP